MLKRGTDETAKKDTCLQYKNGNKKAQCCFVQHLLGWCVLGDSNCHVLCVSTNDFERAASADLGAMNKFQRLGEFT